MFVLKMKKIHNIEYIDFYIGGMRIERMFSHFYPTLQILYGMKTIPFYALKNGLLSPTYHEIYFEIKCKEDYCEDAIILVADKYNNLDVKEKAFIFMLFQIQNFNCKIVDNGMFIYGVHPVYLFIANKRLENIKLIVQKDKFSKAEEFRLAQDEYGVIQLTDAFDINHFSNYCVNLSLVEICKLEYDCDDKEKLKICYIVTHPLRFFSGMAGLAYSK